METKSVTYVGQKELNSQTEKERRRGWRVVSVTEVRQPVGVGRIAAIGPAAIFIKPKPHYYVVYEKD